MTGRIPLLALCSALVAAPLAFGQGPQATPRKVVKTDQEWAKLLTHDQFLVTRRKATEPAFSGKLLHNKARGIYACVCCGSPLFTSKTKFESGTGWPSFFAPYAASNVATETDRSYGETRVEVLCASCGAHLGHVFDDGPPPTGLRYCMNSLALKFVRESPTSAKGLAKKANKTKAESDVAPAQGDKSPATPTGQ